MFDNGLSGFVISIKCRKWVPLVSLASLMVVFFSGCIATKISPEVTQEEKAAPFFHGDVEKTHPTATVKTITWTVECEAEAGKTCAGQMTLTFPPEMEYCRHDYQILEGPAGETAQVVTVDSRSSLKVDIQAVGESGSSHPSRIVVRVRGMGIPKGSGPEIRKVLHCNPVAISENT